MYAQYKIQIESEKAFIDARHYGFGVCSVSEIKRYYISYDKPIDKLSSCMQKTHCTMYMHQ